MNKVPDFKLEQLALGELPPDQAEALRARLAAEPGGLARLAALADDDTATHTRYPARAVAAEVQRRLAARWRQRLTWVALPTLAAAAAAALLLLRPTAPLGEQAFEGFALERAKGPLLPGLAVHRRLAEVAEPLAAGAPVRAGDVLQISLAPRGAGHAVVVSVDGRGVVTVHHPERPEQGTALPAGQATLALPHAYELDDAPAFERFFLVTAHRPIDVDVVVEAARQVASGSEREHAALALPADHAQVDFLLRKAQ